MCGQGSFVTINEVCLHPVFSNGCQSHCILKPEYSHFKLKKPQQTKDTHNNLTQSVIVLQQLGRPHPFRLALLSPKCGGSSILDWAAAGFETFAEGESHPV